MSLLEKYERALNKLKRTLRERYPPVVYAYTERWSRTVDRKVPEYFYCAREAVMLGLPAFREGMRTTNCIELTDYLIKRENEHDLVIRTMLPPFIRSRLTQELRDEFGKVIKDEANNPALIEIERSPLKEGR